MPSGRPSRRNSFVLLVLGVGAFFSLTYLLHLRSPGGSSEDLDGTTGGYYHNVPVHEVQVSSETLSGEVIASKLGNETLKAELGRAAWKLFHTTMAKFPDKPSRDESVALQSYIHLFARLYPCGECASHFRKILEKFPPQVATRSTAAAWACHVHNQVNKSLDKEAFDCSKIGDFYDCGCADEVADLKPEMSEDSKRKIVDGGRKFDDDLFKNPRPLELEKEG
ncbi:MAG: Bud site selection protein bud4 [Chaenotheca gracillima]|nr:MAG: Bud site selection protein bud4 [Chaenotheca gracillima]